MDSIRINKYLAEQGYASRREADELIAAGKVLINGQVATLGQKVSAQDKVEVKTEQLKAKTYLAYHKPRGQATEEINPPVGGATGKLFHLGRLDKDSEGLLLVTNDGRLTERLIGPEAEQEKEYLVTVDKKLDGLDLKRMSEGMKIEDYHTKPAKTSRVNDVMFKIILTEGKKHQIRRMCAALGYQVQELKRLRVANIKLGDLKPKNFRPLSDKEREVLLTKLNLS